MIIEDCLEWVGDFVFGDGDVTNPGLMVDWLGRGDDACDPDGELLKPLASLEKKPVPDCLDGREDERGLTIGAEPPTTDVGALKFCGMSREIATSTAAAAAAGDAERG